MPQLGLYALTAALMAAAALLPVRHGLAVTVGAFLVIPPTLVLPNGYTAIPTVDRLVMASFAVGLLWRRVTGRLPPGCFALTAVHAAFALLLAVDFLTGVALAPATVPAGVLAGGWASLAQTAVVFVILLAGARAVAEPRHVLTALAAPALLFLGIAAAEHVSGGSWGHWLFLREPSQQAQDAAAPLELRDGVGRVRSGAEFALQFGWMAMALLPILVAWAAGRRRALPWAVGVTALAVATMYWSYDRSAALGAGLAALALAVFVRRPRVSVPMIAACALAAIAYAALPGAFQHFSRAAAPGSVDVRAQRLPIYLGLAARHPWRGLGLGSLGIASHLSETDSSYLHRYAETGALGLATLAVLLVTAALVAGGRTWAPDPALRWMAASAASGIVVLMASAFALDSFELMGTSWLLALFAAIGAAGVPARSWAWSVSTRTRWAMVPAAALLGAVLWGVAPVGYAVTAMFRTEPASAEASAAATYQSGPVLANSLCGLVRQVPAAAGVPLTASCAVDNTLGITPGTGTLRLSGNSPAIVRAGGGALRRLLTAEPVLAAGRILPTSAIESGKPSALATAPGWLALLATAAALLVPRRRDLQPGLGGQK